MSQQQAVYQFDGVLKRTLTIDPTQGFDGDFTVSASIDCTGIVETNKALRETQPVGRDFRLLARIPITIWEQAVREGWADDEDKWKAWLNEPDNRLFRVWEGRV